jgi:hypothetical protein
VIAERFQTAHAMAGRSLRPFPAADELGSGIGRIQMQMPASRQVKTMLDRFLELFLRGVARHIAMQHFIVIYGSHTIRRR